MNTVPLGKTGNLFVGKLLRESSNYANLKTESEGEDYYLKGCFLQGDTLNNNKRVYPINVLDQTVEDYKKSRIDNHTAYGQLNHPDSPKIDLKDVAILTLNLEKDGANYMGKARVCHEDCPMGKITRGIIRSGGSLGVSSRGLGSSKKAKWEDGECDMVEHFLLRAIDVVADPSAPDAMVEAIQEEKQYILDESTGEVALLNEDTYKIFENRLKVMPVSKEAKDEKVFIAIKDFLNSLR